jgi:hypothetical protein
MRRGWAPRELRDFAKLHREVEAVVQRCGGETFDLLLIDVEGNWTRAVVPSEEEAEAISRDLGVDLRRGWDDPRLARRMNRRDHWGEPGGRRRAL